MATVILPSRNFFRNSRLRNTRPPSQGNRCSNNVDRERLTVPHCEAQYNLIMGKVKILKRGEAVPSRLLVKKEEEEQTLETHIEDPDVMAFFAGWRWWDSPSPSSVPLPHFLVNNGH